MKKIISIVFLLILLTSCDNEDNEEALIDTNNPNALSEVLIFPDGSSKDNGMPPSPSSDLEAPDVSGNISEIISSNGSTTPLEFSYSNVEDNLGGCYVQVEGADTYFTIPYDGDSENSGNLELPVGIPSKVDEGFFTLNYCVYDSEGRVSNIISTEVEVLRLGTGALQISLSWNTATDQDLHVTTPSGETINWLNTSSDGGELDRDDLDGYGPENIYWTNDAPDGEYTVEVNDYTYTSSTNTVYVTINGSGTNRRFRSTTREGSFPTITTFTKSGNRIIFDN
ncbi:MAG: hypothetical protein Kapaf2KO_16530 [Candidatus Kapaibacteriales bacterium]